MTILELRSITKSYGQDSPAVHNVDLVVQTGELLALTGESGCGKTTLLRLIAGLEHPDSGTIEIEGKLVSSAQGIIPPQKREVGLVFQDYALFPHMTVAANIFFGLKSWTRADANERVEQLIEMVDLSGLQNRYPHQLSGGQQQRVAIARALAPRPKILLLDEPFSNLDTVLKDQVRQELASILKRSGTTVILVTHDVQDALSMANRIAVLKSGILLQVDNPSNLYNQPVDRYTAAFFGKVNLVPVDSPEGRLILSRGAFPAGSIEDLPGCWCLRPEHLKIVSGDQGIEAEVHSINYMGGYKQLRVKLGELELWCHHHSAREFSRGQKVRLDIDYQHVHFIKN